MPHFEEEDTATNGTTGTDNTSNVNSEPGPAPTPSDDVPAPGDTTSSAGGNSSNRPDATQSNESRDTNGPFTGTFTTDDGGIGEYSHFVDPQSGGWIYKEVSASLEMVDENDPRYADLMALASASDGQPFCECVVHEVIAPPSAPDNTSRS